MAIGDRYTGLVWYATWVTAGGTAVLSGDQKTFEWQADANMIDSSGGSVGYKEYLSGIKDGTGKLSTYDTILSTAGSALGKLCTKGAVGTLTWGPLGTAAGKPKYQVGGLVKTVKVAYPFDGDVMRDVDFQFSGPWLANFEESGSVYP